MTARVVPSRRAMAWKGRITSAAATSERDRSATSLVPNSWSQPWTLR